MKTTHDFQFVTFSWYLHLSNEHVPRPPCSRVAHAIDTQFPFLFHGRHFSGDLRSRHRRTSRRFTVRLIPTFSTRISLLMMTNAPPSPPTRSARRTFPLTRHAARARACLDRCLKVRIALLHSCAPFYALLLLVCWFCSLESCLPCGREDELHFYFFSGFFKWKIHPKNPIKSLFATLPRRPQPRRDVVHRA